jgi:hypothetical protein
MRGSADWHEVLTHRKSDWQEVLIDRKCWLTGSSDWQEVLIDRKCSRQISDWQEVLIGRKCWLTGSAYDKFLTGRKFWLTGSADWQEVLTDSKQQECLSYPMHMISLRSAVIAVRPKYIRTCWSRDTWRQTVRNKHRDCATADATQRHSIDVALRHTNLRIYCSCLLLLKMQPALFTPRRHIRGAEVQLFYDICNTATKLTSGVVSFTLRPPYRTAMWVPQSAWPFGEDRNHLSCRDFAKCSTVHDKLTVPQLVKK